MAASVDGRERVSPRRKALPTPHHPAGPTVGPLREGPVAVLPLASAPLLVPPSSLPLHVPCGYRAPHAALRVRCDDGDQITAGARLSEQGPPKLAHPSARCGSGTRRSNRGTNRHQTGPRKDHRVLSRSQVLGIIGAGDRGRTDDLVLGKRDTSRHQPISSHLTPGNLSPRSPFRSVRWVGMGTLYGTHTDTLIPLCSPALAYHLCYTQTKPP